MTSIATPLPMETLPMISAAPQVEYISAAPAVEYITAAPVEYVSPPVVEEVIIPAAPPSNLLAMGTVVSERVITPDELFQSGRFFEAEAERAPAPVIQSAPIVQAAPVVYETIQPQVIEYVEPAYTTAAPIIEYASH